MSSTSTNFAFVLATSSDVVSVTSHIANNFARVDSVFGIAHTGSGQLKSGLTLTNYTLVNPTISGTISSNVVMASTGSFQTITASGGIINVSTFSIGSYSYPTTVGTNSTILTVVTSNAVWAAAAPNTGANLALSNIATVALGASLGTGSAGFFTFARVIATSGSITGLTVFQATTGTFAGSVTVSGTLTANVLNCTGGAITAGGFAIGTYSYPNTLGSTGQILRVASSTLSFVSPTMSTAVAFRLSTVVGATAAGATGTAGVVATFTTEDLDVGGNVTTAGVFTAPANGIYQFSFLYYASASAGFQAGAAMFGMILNTNTLIPMAFVGTTGTQFPVAGIYTTSMGSGGTVAIGCWNGTTAAASCYIIATAVSTAFSYTGSGSYFSGKRLFEF